MIYACLIWEYPADTHLLKVQRLRKRVLRDIGNPEKCTKIREMHVASKFLTRRTRAEVILNHINPNVRGTGKVEVMHRTYKGLKLGSGQAYDRSAD
jgi:hypothetical protein